MKRITAISVKFFLLLLIASPLYPNMAPPPSRLDINIDGEWSSSSGETFIIKDSASNRRFTITLKQKGAADTVLTAYIGYDGNSFIIRQASKSEYVCKVKDQNTIEVAAGDKKYTWLRNIALKSKANANK
jgi:hypothetical protein